MNIREEIFKLVTDRGCSFTMKNGIVYVYPPDGTVWDFTIPQISDHPEEGLKKMKARERRLDLLRKRINNQ